MTRFSLAHCKRSETKRKINNKNSISKKEIKKGEGFHVVNLESFADADGDEGLGAQSLNGERNGARYVSYCSKRFENPHLLRVLDTKK